MQMSQAIFIVSVVAVALSGLSFYFWRRSASLYALLVEGANRYEELRHRAVAFEAKSKDQEAKVRDFHQKALQADKAATEARNQSQDFARVAEGKAQELTYVTDKLERQKGYLEGLVEKQTAQIEALDNARQILESTLSQQQAEASEKIEKLTRDKDAQLLSFRDQLKGVKTDFERSQLELQQVTKKASEADPIEMKRLRRKVSQYARLYITMKGLKELAEERSHNWEVALAKLSTWVIHQKQGAKATVPRDLGPLIGQALKLTGQQLIHDDEGMASDGGETILRSPSELDAAVASHLGSAPSSEHPDLRQELLNDNKAL